MLEIDFFISTLKAGGEGIQEKNSKIFRHPPNFCPKCFNFSQDFLIPTPLFHIGTQGILLFHIKNCLFNGQWVCLGLLCEKMDNLMVRKGNKWHRKKYFLTRKKSKSHTFDTHHPHHMFLGFFPDLPC